MELLLRFLRGSRERLAVLLRLLRLGASREEQGGRAEERQRERLGSPDHFVFPPLSASEDGAGSTVARSGDRRGAAAGRKSGPWQQVTSTPGRNGAVAVQGAPLGRCWAVSRVLAWADAAALTTTVANSQPQNGCLMIRSSAINWCGRFGREL
jgi:hypothetical protein